MEFEKKLGELRENLSFENLFSILCSHADKTAAEYRDDDGIKKLTYADYERISIVGAAKLSELLEGTEKNTFVALRFANHPLWPAAFWAIILAGFRPLLIDSASDDNQIMHILKQAGSRTIVSDTEVGVGGVKAISPFDFLSFESTPVMFTAVCGDAIALCTSGTTSSPKVYVYLEDAVCEQVLLADYICKNNKEIIHDGQIKQLAFLPFHHIFGLIAVYMWYQFFGKTIVYIKNRTADVILSACKEHKVTHIYAVPLLWNNVAKGIIRNAKLQGEKTYEKLIGAAELSITLQRKLGKLGKTIASKVFFKEVQQKLVGDSIQFMISGGAHIKPEAIKLVNALGYHLVSGFGMTETGINSVELSNNIDHCIEAGVGKPFAPMEYRLLKENPDAKTGELQIKGKAIHSGRMVDGVYIPRDLSGGGWFSSGDIVREDKGRYFIEGRVKDVIINESGENVYPDELEDSFTELPNAEHICVVGISSGEVYDFAALVVYMGDNAGDKNKFEELAAQISKINSLLPIYKKINKAYISLEPLPMANGIKVRRQKVKESIEAGKGSFEEINISSGKVKTAPIEQIPQHKKPVPAVDSGMASIKEEVRKIFGEELHLDPSEIGDTDHFVDDLGGDSLTSLGVFAKAEEKYNVIIRDTEYFTCANVEDLARLVYGKIHNIDPSEHIIYSANKKRIDRFDKSREFEEFAKRMLEMKTAGIQNPYFVAHDSVLKDTSTVDGKQVINLASYNYLGMSGHPRTSRAAKEAIDKYGTSASGSRLIAGEKTLYHELEKAISDWKHTEDSIVLVGGHSTNVTFVGNFCNENDLIVYDALSHNSIVQGCQLSKSDTKAFSHNDFDMLENILKAARAKYEKILVIVEGVYSMDGDIAPIPKFIELKKKYGIFLMVDEAHSSCVIGQNGGGVDDYFGLNPSDIDIRMGTLSKGLGTCGGYIAGERAFISYLRYNLPGFVFSVGISPPLAAATLEAVRMMIEGNPKVKDLHSNITYFVEGAKKRGFNTCLASEAAIIPIMVGRDMDACSLSAKMLENGVYVPAAVYPAVPKGQARLRFCLTSEHKPAQLDEALGLLDRLFADLGLQK